MSSKNLKAAAIIAGVRAADLADQFGVWPQTVSRWLNRKLPVPDKYKREFAAKIGVGVDDLLPASDERDAAQ